MKAIEKAYREVSERLDRYYSPVKEFRIQCEVKEGAEVYIADFSYARNFHDIAAAATSDTAFKMDMRCGNKEKSFLIIPAGSNFVLNETINMAGIRWKPAYRDHKKKIKELREKGFIKELRDYNFTHPLSVVAPRQNKIKITIDLTPFVDTEIDTE
jgi:hypothetical protein